MERVIKFRGKRIDNWEWVFGSLIVDYNIEEGTSCRIVQSEGKYDWFSVESSTVGQFTGKKDSKGVEIYEGDYLEDVFEGKTDKFLVKWYDYGFGLFQIKDDDKLDMRYSGSPDYMDDCLVIIGNVFETPDLIK